MKFNYLKLSLLFGAFVVPVVMHGEAIHPVQAITHPIATADVDGAVALLLELTDLSGTQKKLTQTMAMIDQIITKLEGDAVYKETCDALRDLKALLIKFELLRAPSVWTRVTTKLQTTYQAISGGLKEHWLQRLEQLKGLQSKPGECFKLLTKLGVKI